MPGTAALVAAFAPIVVGVLGLIGTRWVAGIQRKARENEERLKGYEAYDHTYANLRADYDRVTTENVGLRVDLRRVRDERDTALRNLETERQRIEKWLQDRG